MKTRAIPDLDFKLQAKIRVKETPDGLRCASEKYAFFSKFPKEHVRGVIDEDGFYQILADACTGSSDGYYDVTVVCKMKFTRLPEGGAVGDCKIVSRKLKPLLAVVH